MRACVCLCVRVCVRKRECVCLCVRDSDGATYAWVVEGQYIIFVTHIGNINTGIHLIMLIHHNLPPGESNAHPGVLLSSGSLKRSSTKNRSLVK